MATTTGSKRLLNISSEAMAASNSMTYGGLNVATEQFVSTQLSNLISSAPGALDTLNELAAAIGDDANFATTVTNSIATKLDASVNPLKAASVSNDTITFTRADNTTFAITTSDANTDTNYYLNGITRSGNTLTFSVSGTTNRTYTFGSAAWSATSAFDAAGTAAVVNDRIDTEVLPSIPTNNNQLTNGAGYVTSSGNTIIGTDSDINTSGSTIIDNIYVTDGVITSMGTRVLTLADLGFTGATNANYITNNNQLTNGAGYLTTTGKAADSNLLDGLDSSRFLYTTTGAFSGDWNDLTNSDLEIQLREVQNITSGAHSNYPTGVYTYGSVLGWQLSSATFKLYASHTGDLVFQTGWNNDGYSGWRNIIHSANIGSQSVAYATNAGAVAWSNVTSKPSTFTPSAHTHAISDVDGLQGELDAKQPAGSYAASNHNHTYNVNDSWLRENGDNANVKLYGNTRQMVFRTDGTTEYASGVGGYAFAWMYGGDAAGNRRMLLGSDGRIWSSYHGWLDSAFASASHNHNSQYDALGSADAVNTRIDEDVLPAIPTNNNQLTNGAGYITGFDITTQTDGKYLRSNADDSFSGALTSTARNNGIFGTYDSTKTDHIWSMGTSYKNSSTGANFGNLYGIAYKHTNNTTGGTMAGGHQMVWCTNGNPKAALGEDGVWTSGHGTSANWKQAYDNYITGAAFSGTTTKTLTLTQRDGGTITASFSDASGSGGDGYLSGLAFNTGNGVLTATVTGGTNVTVDLDGRYEGAGAAATVNDRIDTEVLPAIGAVTLATLGYTGATNANYITNNNQLTNGAGYITDGNTNWNNSYGFITEASYIKAGGAGPSTENLNTIADSVVPGKLEYRGFNLASSNRPPASDNANGVITVGQHSGNYNAQLAFSSDGNMYWRDNPSTSYGSWRTVWDSGNLDAFVGATVSNDTITFTKANGGTVAVTTSDADTNTWRGIHDSPVDGATTTSISSNWAFDNVKTPVPANAVFTDNNTTYSVGDGGLTQKNFTTTLKTKLDGIAAGATNVTNNNQLTNGAGYITSVPTTLSGNRTIGGDLTVSGNQVITAGANADVKFSVWDGTTYGIGMTSGVTYGGLNDYAMTFCMNNDTDRGFWWGYSGQTKSAGAMSLTTGGVLTVASSITAGGDITAFSDARVKENIETIDNALDKVTQLRGVEYTRIGAEERSIGVIAQEVQEVLPEVVREGQDGMLSVAYGNITGVLIEAIKEQQKQIEELKAQLDGLTK